MSEITLPEDAPVAKRAAGSSFYLAMRILPRAQREAMFEIYSFCRAVDDIADSEGPRDARIVQLRRWRQDIDAIFAGDAPPHLKGLAKSTQQFGLQRADFVAVIDGMEMDIVSTIRAPDMATLDLYCDRVASAVGRLSVRIFGMPHDDGIALAYHLGRALQLTNILRDIDEDAEIGRLYLPKEPLRDAGIHSDDPHTVLAAPALGRACAPLVALAKEHFIASDAIMARNTRASVRAPRIMYSAYREILDRLEQRGFAAPRERIRMNKGRLLLVVLRQLFF